MEDRKYATEESEPMELHEPAVAYGTVKSDFDREWENAMTVEEFHDYCVKRINEVYGIKDIGTN